MGFGLPAAIGAQLGDPDRLTVVISGDGSIQMNIQELATVRQEGLPIKIVVMNNGYLGMVRQWQELFWDERYSHVDMQTHGGEEAFPDFVKLADAYGIRGARLRRTPTRSRRTCGRRSRPRARRSSTCRSPARRTCTR